MILKIGIIIIASTTLLSAYDEFIYNNTDKNVWIQKLVYAVNYLGSKPYYAGEEFVTYKPSKKLGFLKRIFKPYILPSRCTKHLQFKDIADCYLISDNDDFTTYSIRNFIYDWQPKLGAVNSRCIKTFANSLYLQEYKAANNFIYEIYENIAKKENEEIYYDASDIRS
jgi:hypothetical protein